MNTKVQLQITGDMIDGYAELILGTFFLTGILRKQSMSKFENADKSHTLIVRAETSKPPLGSLGLKDIPEEYPKITMNFVASQHGGYYTFHDAEGDEVFSLEKPQMSLLIDVMKAPNEVKAAILKAAQILGKDSK